MIDCFNDTSISGTLRIIGKNWEAALRDIDNPVSEDYVPAVSQMFTLVELQNWKAKLESRIELWTQRSTSGKKKEMANAATILEMLYSKLDQYESAIDAKLALQNQNGNPINNNGGGNTPPVYESPKDNGNTEPGTSGGGNILGYGLLIAAGILLFKRL